MAAYIVVQGSVTDPEGFAAYAGEVSRLVGEMGGRYLAVSSDVQVLEGDWQHRSLVIHQWPDLPTARRFWNSDQYGKIRQLRDGCGTFVVLLTDGLTTQVMP